MIPFVIQYIFPRDHITKCNVVTRYGSCNEKELLNENFFKFIANFMYEFCTDYYGDGFIITSYDDFHNKFWSVNWDEVKDWLDIFKIFYFESDKWIEWNVKEHQDAIFQYYVDQLLISLLKN
jgi:hypothetical protein